MRWRKEENGSWESWPVLRGYGDLLNALLKSSQKLATLPANIMARTSRPYPVRIRRPYAHELDLQYEGRLDERCARFVVGLMNRRIIFSPAGKRIFNSTENGIQEYTR